MLTLSATPATLTYGASADLTAHGCGSRGRAEPCTASAPPRPTSSRSPTAPPAPDGTFALDRQAPGDDRFRVDQAAGQTWEAASAETTVGVRHRVTLTAAAATPLIEDKYVRYTVSVRPAHAGGTAQLQRWTGDAWVALADVDAGRRLRRRRAAPGRQAGQALVVRAQMAADAGHLAGNSRAWKRTVYDRRNPYGVPTKYPHLILVDLSKYKLYYHEHGVVIRVFDCVLGRPSLPTPKGHFKIYAKDPHMGGPYGPFRMRYLGLYADPRHQRAVAAQPVPAQLLTRVHAARERQHHVALPARPRRHAGVERAVS